MISVREIDFPDIRDEWLALEKDGHIPTIFQTYDWMETWWKHLGFRGRKLVLVAYDGNELIGIAPLYISKLSVKRVPLFNVVRLIGAGESDYQAFILKGGREEVTLKELLDFLGRFKWDIFWLSDVHPETATNRLIPKILETAGYYYTLQQHTPCPYIHLPKTFEEYKKTLSRNSRRNLTKFCNRVEMLDGIKYCKVQKAEDLKEAMETFFHLHQSRWQKLGQKGALAEKEVRIFHLEVASRLLRYLDLRQLKLKDRAIAATYSYDFNGNREVYLPGMNMEFEYYSLGYVMMGYSIKDAIACGLQEFDFMRGDEEYKFHFTHTIRHNMRYFFSKSSLKFKGFCKLEGIS
jgi:CelD/BcsL family acetyltransferase involved in cellulose biosynthesis